MKRIILILILVLYSMQSANAAFFFDNSDEKAVRRVLNSQVKYANNNNLKKLISTYDKDYVNGDGFNLEVYSKLVKDIWETYKDIEYDIVVKNISINGENAVVDVIEKSYADVIASHVISGELKSISNSIYYLRKTEKGWKVLSDKVLDETTTLLYGDALSLDVKLTVPEKVLADTEYSAMLEFVPPEHTIAVASISSDKVEYPQKQTKEVFRVLPEDNILERLFISNNENVNEYIIASIGLTKTSVEDLSVKLSLTGFGYIIKRVNVLEKNIDEEGAENINVQNK